MMKLVLFVTLLIAVFSLLMNILLWMRINKVSKKRRELKDIVYQNQKSTTTSLENHKQYIESLLFKVKLLENAPKQPIQQPVQQPVQQPIQQPVQQPVQQPIQQPVQQVEQQPVQQQPVQQSGKNKHNKHGKNRDKGNGKPQKPVIIKTIFLGINSDDFFFDNEVDDQKSATSKFIGQLTSDTEGTFVPIDVERIRSANVAASVKQHGMISLKDAQSFNVIEPGKIHKEDQGWVIENPVVVEFVK